MSVAREITRLQGAKADLKTAIEGKGVTVPSATKLDGYADLVDDIQTGGGGASVTSISAVYTPSTTVFLSTNLSELYDDLVVTATIGTSLQVIVSSDEYALSGTLAVGTNTITVSYGGKSTTFSVTATEVYERKTYIESDGNCYIDLGFTPDQRCEITVDYMSLKQSGSAYQAILGATPLTDGTLTKALVVALQIYSANTINWACTTNGSNTTTTSSYWNYQERKTATIYCMNPSLSIDGTSISNTMLNPLNTTLNANMYLFARNSGGAGVVGMATGRCYSFTATCHLVQFRDCVPVRKLSNGEYGLLDLVFGVFYGASGSGTLTGA